LVAKSKQQALKHQNCWKKEKRNTKKETGKKHKQKMGREKQEK